MIAVHLLGSFNCSVDGKLLPASLSRKTRAVLAYLATTNHPHSRQALIDLFCQESDDPAGALRWHLSRIRRHLRPELLIVNSDTVQFDHTTSWVDSREFQTVLTALNDQDESALIKALSLYRGEFLATLNLPDAPEFEIWLLAQRTQFHQLYERGVLILIERLIEQEKLLDALPWAQKLVQHNALFEAAHARLIWLYARMGQREAALQQFQKCRELLQRELAVEPSEELIALHQEIMGGLLTSGIAVSSAAKFVLSTLEIRPVAAIGRQEELEKLHAAWVQTQHDRVAVVLIEAEAGGGKTHLMTDFASQIVTRCYLAARCYESTHHLPYQPWIGLLETRLAEIDSDTLGTLEPFWLHHLSRLLPKLASRHSANHVERSKTPADEQYLFRAVIEFLLRLPQTAPLMVFLDDLQWADESSLRLFQFVAHRARDLPDAAPLLLVGAYRTEEVEDNPILPDVIHELRRTRSLLTLHLPPLNEETVQTLIARQWTEHLPDSDGARLCDAVLKVTGGNPLYVTEVLHELHNTAQLPSQLPIPPSLYELVQRRLRQLPASGRQVIEAMAILDAPSTSQTAQRISGRSEDEVYVAIDSGLRWRLLRTTHDETPARFDFSHDLMREAVRRQLNAIRRQRLHQRTAATLVEMGAPAAQLAFHWHEAGDIDKEAHYVVLAGEDAAKVYSNREAKRYLQRALEINTDVTRRAELMIKLGDVLFSLGEWDEAEKVYLDALEIAKREGLTFIQATSQFGMGQLERNRARFAVSLEWLKQAQQLFTQLGNRKWLHQTLGGIGSLYWRQANHEEALTHLALALEIATEIADAEGIGLAHGGIASVYAQMGEHEPALHHYEKCLQSIRERNDRSRLSKVIANIGIIYAEQGDDARAQGCFLEQVLDEYKMGDALGLSTALNNVGTMARLLGAFDEATICGLYSLDIALRMKNLRGVAICLGDMASTLLDQALYEEAAPFSARAIAMGRAFNFRYELCEWLLVEAQRLHRLMQFYDALTTCLEGLDRAQQIQRRNAVFQAQIMKIELRTQLRQVEPQTAIQQLRQLLNQWTQPEEQAVIYDTIWAIDPTQAPARAQAAALYRDLYTRTPDMKYARRFTALTGDTLPPPAIPLELPDFVRSQSINMDTLMVQVDVLMAAQ